ncbi:hypothetical protein GF312_14115 [Candidatus Poribacteria bacterium]|nr:hypothetical protein [Candidatus Poribacteria bacterium]
MRTRFCSKTIIRLFILLIFTLSASIVYAIDANSIVGVWTLDEGQGDDVMDSSGNENHGENSGAQWVDGVSSTALEFDGVSHVNIPASDTTDDIEDGFTYMLWVMPTGTPPNANTRIIERDWHNPTIQIGATDFYGSIAVNADQANTNVRGGLWAMNEWSFVALTYDGESLRLYVDGEMVGEKEVGTPDAQSNNAPAPYQNAIWLGAWKAPGWDFTGVIDEVAIFNVALSDDEIVSIMNNGISEVLSVESIGKMSVTWGFIKN